MKEFIDMAVAELGIGSDTARSATGGLLRMVQENVAAGDFRKLLDAVPGAAELIPAVPPPDRV